MTDEELAAIESESARVAKICFRTGWAATGTSLAEHVAALTTALRESRAEVERLRDLCAYLESEPHADVMRAIAR